MQDYELLKVPDEVMIAEQKKEIKALNLEIGSLNSYILELEYLKKQYEKEHIAEFKNSELYKEMRTQINNLESKIKKINKDNESLLLKLVKNSI